MNKRWLIFSQSDCFIITKSFFIALFFLLLLAHEVVDSVIHCVFRGLDVAFLLKCDF